MGGVMGSGGVKKEGGGDGETERRSDEERGGRRVFRRRLERMKQVRRGRGAWGRVGFPALLSGLFVERSGFEIGGVDPAGADFVAAHEAFVEVYVGGVGVRVAVEDGALAKHARVALGF